MIRYIVLRYVWYRRVRGIVSNGMVRYDKYGRVWKDLARYTMVILGYDIVCYNMVHAMVEFDIVWYGTVQHDTVNCGMGEYDMV